MSHTILKADRTSHSTLYNEVAGRLEVYWEEMRRRPGNKEEARHQQQATQVGYSTVSKNATHDGYSVAPRHIPKITPNPPKRNGRWFF